MDSWQICSLLLIVLAVTFTHGQDRNTDSDSGKTTTQPRKLKLEPRIIGGEQVDSRCNYPYNSVVALQVYTSTRTVILCGAVMLTPQILVTAAYCIRTFPAGSHIFALVGALDMYGEATDEQTVEIVSYKVHKNYDATTRDYNIALLKLSEPAKLSESYEPCIENATTPEKPETDYFDNCTMVGWGPWADISSPSNSRMLRYAPLILLGSTVSKIVTPHTRKPVGSVLAITKNPRMKSCYFDWGGLVNCVWQGKNIFRGVVGDHNCMEETENMSTPVPFPVTDVYYFKSWMDNCVANWDNCLAQ